MVAPNRVWAKLANITNTTAVTIQPAVVGTKHYVNAMQYQNKHATVATVISILSAGVAIWQASAPAVMAAPVQVVFNPPLPTDPNSALTVNNTTTGSDVLYNLQGFSGT